MCGICGIWYFNAQHQPTAALLEGMTTQIAHRGPDDAGIYLDGNVGLGFRRLSIIDVGGSHQPMANEDDSVWIVFNGEIYNYQDLRRDLVQKHSFRTAGDTETVVHAFEEYGIDCVNRFRGMFAFAIWDRHTDQMSVAVDRFGKKPLYYLLDSNRFIFASEIKAILQHPDISREIDLEALDEYLSCGYVSAPRTIFKSIRKLQPGCTLVIQGDGRSKLTEYWHPSLCQPEQYDQRPFEVLAAELKGLLSEAVRLRMISDVPLGAFLSGGVDSSAVVGLMSEISNQPVKTFSIGFDEQLYDETHYAQMVADHCHTDHIREVVRPDVIAILPRLIHQYDEPFADASMIPTYYVSEMARKHVTVALSGDGGDEVFAGYATYRRGFRHRFLQSVIPVSLRPVAAQTGRLLPRFTKLGPYLAIVDRNVQYWGIINDYFDPQQRRSLYMPDTLHKLAGCEMEYIKRDVFSQAQKLDWLSQLQYNDLRVYMPGDILVKVDRASMLASLEVRCPLLDHVVFEFMAKVPPKYKMSRSDSKIVLKQAIGPLLPSAIHSRNKRGFEIPLREWLSGPLQPLLRDTLLASSAFSRQLFDTRTVAALIDEHTSGQANHKGRLWALLCFELWAQEYVA